MVFLLRIFKICTQNGQINTIKTGLNKDLVLGDPIPPSMVKDHTFALFNFGTLPLVHNVLTNKTMQEADLKSLQKALGMIKNSNSDFRYR